MMDDMINALPVATDDGPLVGWWDAVNYWDNSYWTQSVDIAWQHQKEMERVCDHLI